MWEPYGELPHEVREAIESCAPVLLPDVNLSSDDADIVEGSIRMGLRSIRGLDDNMIEALLFERAQGPFTGLDDLLSRVPILHRKPEAITGLIKSGSLDCFACSRLSLLDLMQDPAVLRAIDDYWNRVQQVSFDFDSEVFLEDQSGLLPFPKMDLPMGLSMASDLPEDQFTMEHEALRYGPYDLQTYPYANAKRLLGVVPLKNVQAIHRVCKEPFITWGRIRDFEFEKILYGKEKGALAVSATLEDQTGCANVSFRMKKRAFASLGISKGTLVQVGGRIDRNDPSIILATYVRLLKPAREMIRRLMIFLPMERITQSNLYRLKSILDSCPGIDSVYIKTRKAGKTLRAKLPIRVDSRNPVLFSFLYGEVDGIEVDISFDEILFEDAFTP